MSYDLIIVGGGPAGVTAGIYGSRQGLKTLLITKAFGGQLNYKAVLIDNYPGIQKIPGMELARKLENHLRSQNIDVEMGEVVKVKKEKGGFSVLTGQKKFQGNSIIIASGAKVRHLNIKGEKEFLGKGVGYCVVCDGSFFQDKKVAVIGGGDTGFEAAQFLSKIAKKIYVLEYSEKPKANTINQEIVEKDEKVEIITSAEVLEIKGDKFVKSIVYRDRLKNKNKEIEVDGVFIQIGLKTNYPDLGDLVEFNSNQQIVYNLENYQTKTPGLFVAGDVGMGKFKQIIIACGEGAIAALSAFNYLKSK